MQIDTVFPDNANIVTADVRTLLKTQYPQSVTDLFVYGDSITEGVGASPSSNGWSYLLATALGLTRFSGAISGASLADWAPNQFATAVEVDQITAILPGFNDQLFVGNVSANKQETYRRGLGAAGVFAVVPDDDKIYAADTTTGGGGSWSTLGGAFPGYTYGSVTTNQNAYREATVYGSVIYAVMLAQPGCGEVTVKVDGTDYGPFDLDVESENGGAISTIDYTPYLIRIEVGGGYHAVRVTKTDSGGAPMPFLFMAGSGSAALAKTTLLLGNTLKYNGLGSVPSGYTNYSVAGNNAFCLIAQEVATQLASDGFDVRLVDATSAYNPFATPAQTGSGGDNVHPNNLGHSYVAEAFERAARGVHRQVAGNIPKGLISSGSGFLSSTGPCSPEWLTLAQTRVRLTSTGNFGFGCAPIEAYRVAVETDGTHPYPAYLKSTVAANGTHVHNAATSGDNVFFGFYTEASPTLRGLIDFDRGGTAVRYNTTSDARLKENPVPAGEAGAIIDAIPVEAFDWIETGEHVPFGFRAQNLYAVVPNAVRVGGDDPHTDPWAVDYSKMVPLLVREVQSLRGRLAAAGL